VKPISEMTRADLGAFVQTHLRRRGIDVVLSGGACVSIYTRNRYESMDLDMIHISLMKPKRRSLCDAMRELGFTEDGRYFNHADTELFIEFPPGPPAVGEEPVKEIQERHEATGMLKIISPTDCVKDRLTWYYHDNDLQCLEQAALVAQENVVDIEEVERWSKGEGKLEAFRTIRMKLER
jgi:predicted nucleotidyltransferase